MNAAPASRPVGVLLYFAAGACLWWIPLRQAAQLITFESARCNIERRRTGRAALTWHSTQLSINGQFTIKGLEVDMRHAIVGVALLGVALATSVDAQPTSYSSSNAKTLATGELPTVSAMPLYFRIIGATIGSGEESGVSAGNGILYQISGAMKISTGAKIKTIGTGEGMFIPGGSRLTLKALGSEPSTYLHFLISSASNLDEPGISPKTGKEIYRSTSPIPGLKDGSYLLNLSKVTLPANAPSDRPPFGSGFAFRAVGIRSRDRQWDDDRQRTWLGLLRAGRIGLSVEQSRHSTSHLPGFQLEPGERGCRRRRSIGERLRRLLLSDEVQAHD
jgi:hypothetical protein